MRNFAAVETRRYYYNPSWQVLCEYDGSENFKMAYVYGNYVDEVLYKKAFSPLGNKYYLHDHLYGVAALVHGNGVVNERYEYDAYGNPTIWDSSFSTERQTPSYNNRYLFTGRRLDLLNDGDSTLQYNRHRYYDYDTGRWLTHDPLGIRPGPSRGDVLSPISQYDGGLNLWQYVSSNPLIKEDPYGLTYSMMPGAYDWVESWREMCPTCKWMSVTDPEWRWVGDFVRQMYSLPIGWGDMTSSIDADFLIRLYPHPDPHLARNPVYAGWSCMCKWVSVQVCQKRCHTRLRGWYNAGKPVEKTCDAIGTYGRLYDTSSTGEMPAFSRGLACRCPYPVWFALPCCE